MKRLFIFLSLAVLICACGRAEWSEPEAWYQSKEAIDEAFADVFYLVSTNILHEEYEDGTISYRAFNTTEEKALLSREMKHLESKVFPDSLNFFAPYYHQHTMDAINLGAEEYTALSSEITEEVYAAFKYYLRHFNHGRPVVLCGFSQGAMLTKEMMKRMTANEASKVAAAYLLGWGLSEEDCLSDNIKPARGQDDTGVCISFNSVADTSAIWPAIMNNASYSINPVNWKTTDESAEFQYAGQNLTAMLDTVRNILVINGFEEPQLPFTAVWPKGCLHFYEIQFYNANLNRNALERVRNFN